MANEWEDRGRYGRGGYGNDRGRGSQRGERDWSDRAGDEVRSWFGDEDAERRRRMEDDRRGSRDNERDYRSDPYGGTGGYADRGVGVGGSYAGGYDQPRRSGGFGGSRQGYAAGDLYGYSGRGSLGSSDDDMGWGSQSGSSYRGDRSHGGRGYGGREEDRGFMERAGDEVASWFGDEDAERRRKMDARHRGRGPKNYTRTDDRIREDVNDRLSDDPHIDASEIEVSVSSGEVTLDGTVSERFAKRHAEDLAERISGVKHVQNNLRISAQQASSGLTGTSTGGTTGQTGGTSPLGGRR